MLLVMKWKAKRTAGHPILDTKIAPENKQGRQMFTVTLSINREIKCENSSSLMESRFFICPKKIDCKFKE